MYAYVMNYRHRLTPLSLPHTHSRMNVHADRLKGTCTCRQTGRDSSKTPGHWPLATGRVRTWQGKIH